MSRHIRIAAFMVVVAAVRLSAATHTWTGAASNLFSDPRNWSGGSPAGDPDAQLVFPEALRQSVTNDIAGLTVRSITFATDGYVLRGQAITLVEGAEIEARENEIACELRFDGTVVEAPVGAHARFTREARPEIAAGATPRVDAQSEVLTFGTGVASARVTQYAETAWLAMVHQGNQSAGRFERYATRVSDTNGDGIAQWHLSPTVTTPSPVAKWCVVDQSARRIYAATGEGTHIEPAPLNARFLVDTTGNYSIADIAWSSPTQRGATLWVRPGVGAWQAGAGASAQLAGGATNRALVFLPQMSPVAGSPSAPPGVEPGDIFVGLSVAYFTPGEVFGGLVDDALAASRTNAAEVGLWSYVVREQDGSAMFRIARYGSTERAVTVSYRLSDYTAFAGVHYEQIAGTVTLERGEQYRNISFPLINDDIYSGEPAVRIQLRDVTGATIIGNASANLGIAEDDPKPIVSAVDGSVVEGGDGERQAQVELTLSGKTRSPADVQVRAYVQGNSDPQVTPVVFATGETRKTIAIQYSGNSVPERDRTIRIEILSGQHAVAGREGIVYIADDDSVGLTAHDVTVSEAAGSASVLVTLNAPVADPVTVTYDTGPGDYRGADFVQTTGQLTFQPGQTEKRVTVPIIQDQIPEADNVVTLTLSGATPNALIRRSARITITDDGDLPSITLEDVTVEETSFANLTFRMTPMIERRMRFGLRAIAGTATAGVDYKNVVETYYGTSGYIEVGPNTDGDFIAVGVYGDGITEPDETFTVEMFEYGNPSNVLASATVRIKDLSTVVPTLSVTDAAAREGQTASFTVTLSQPSQQTVSFRARTVSDGAEAGNDYQAVSAIYTLTPGTVSVSIDVSTLGDSEVEGDERFAVELSEPFNAAIGDGIGRALIFDNDEPNLPSVTVEHVSAPESAATARFHVRLAAAAPSRMVLSYATSDGTAKAGEDYVAATGTLVFEKGEIAKTIDVALVNDANVETDETFTLRLSKAADAVCTIVNDDVKKPGRVRSVRH